MPFALLFIGILLIVVGFQDTYKQFGNQVIGDFSGSNSFFWWLVAIGAVGAIGYVRELRNFSRAFMALIIVAIFLSKTNQGFFSQFTTAIQQGATAPINPVGTSLPGTGSSVSSGSNSTGGNIAGGLIGGALSAFGL